MRTDDEGGVIRLSDLARVELGASGYAQRATMDGEETCFIDVYRQTDANALATAKRIKEEIAALEAGLPLGVRCRVAYDPTLYIETSIREIVWTLVLALVLVIGSLCDDAIVVTENCRTLIERDGLEPRAAAHRCMREITGAVVATTLVTFACYVPFLFYGGLVGRIYVQFAVTMSIALGFSTVVALVLTPVLCALLLRPRAEKGVSRIFLPFNAFLSALRAVNLHLTGFLVRHALVTVVLTAMVALGIWGLSRTVEPGFIPDEDKGFFMCDIELAPGTALARTEKVLEEFLSAVRDVPGVDTVMLDAGSSMMSGTGENYGTGFIQLKDWSERRGPGLSQDEILEEIQSRADGIAEARISCMAMSPLMDLGTTDGLEFQFCSEKGTSGAGSASRQSIGLVTFGGMLMATLVGICFPPAYFALIERVHKGRTR